MQSIGVFGVPVTIFNNDLSIDWKSTEEHTNWIIQSGVRTLLCGGTVAELHALEPSERVELIERFLGWVDGRLPVYPCVSSTSTQGAIKLAHLAQSAGAHGVFCTPPYYGAMTENECLTFFRDVAGAIDIPLMAYNNPWATTVRMSLPAMVQLAKEGTIESVKDSQGDPTPCHNLRLLAPDSVKVIYGEDTSAFEAIMAGADGWVSGVGNFMPRRSVKLWDLCVSGNAAEARSCWYEVLPAINMTSVKPAFGRPEERPDFCQVYKAALDHMGLRGGPCRPPLAPLSQQDRQYVCEVVDALKLTPDTA